MSIISNHTSPRARGTRAGRHAGLALIHILFMTLLLTMALALPFSGMTGTAAYAQAQQQDAAPSATGAKSTGAQPAAPDATPPQAAAEQKGTQAPTPAPAPAPGAATGPAAGQASPQGSAPAATPAASAAPVPAAPAKPLAADAVTADSINGAVQKQLTHIHDQLTGFQKSVHQDADDDADLAALRVKADAIISEMQALSDKLKGRGEQIQSRLTALGDAPKAGAPPETPVVSEERTRLTNERAELNVVSENANQLSNSAVQLGNTITNLRRSLFARTLFRHTELSPDLFTEAAQAQRYQFSDFTSTVGSWLSFVIRFKPLQLVGALILSIGAGLLFLFGGYRLLGRLTRRNDGQEAPSYIRRLSVAFWSTITETVALAAFLSSSFLFLDGFNVLRSDVSTMVASFFGTVWFVFFVAKLSNAVLSPRDQDWRLVRVTNRGAKYLSVAVISMAVINSLDYFLSAVAEALSSPLALTIVKSLVASVIISLIVACISFLKPVMPAGGEPEDRGRGWPRFFPLIMRLVSIVLLLSAVSGYIGLARFLSTQLVLTSAVLVLIYIGLLSGKAISKQGSFRDTGVGRWLTKRFRFGDVALDQSGLLAGLGIYAFALFFGIPLIMLTWGFQISDIESWIFQVFTRITIGNISISLVGILGGIVLFGVGYIVTGWVQKWIDSNVMARSQVDLGVRNSVRTGIGYLGVGLAMIVGVSAAGIDLSSFALVASALSVGIGFGLQNIVSNFVSGLILLVERPFKVGDQVITGTTEGIVKRISVRATEIETFRKQSIIVPNSELINSPVGNWTHRNRIQRSEIPVSVSFGSDPQQVMDILLELVNDLPEVLRNPEPHVEFLRFAGSSLDFELRFHLADMADGLPVRNNLRIAILRRFREAGIDMPVPQQEIVFHQGKALPMMEEGDGRGGA